MGVAGRHARGLEQMRGGAVEQNVRRQFTLHMPALHQNGVCPGCMNRTRQTLKAGGVMGRIPAAQAHGFRHVGRDDARQRQQMPYHRLHYIGRAKRIATGGDKHRIEHDVARSVRPQTIRHGLDNGAGGQHAELYGIDPHVFEDRVDLCSHEIGRGHMNGADAARVLRRERSDSGHAVTGQSREGFQIGLHARAAGGI